MWTIQSMRLLLTQGSVVMVNKVSTLIQPVSVKLGTCVWTLIVSGASCVPMEPFSTRRYLPASGGLILTVTLLRASTVSMMISTVKSVEEDKDRVSQDQLQEVEVNYLWCQDQEEGRDHKEVATGSLKEQVEAEEDNNR